MTIEENLNDIEKGFKEFSEKMDVFLDSFAESLYDLKKQIKTENKVPAPSGLWKPKEGEEYWTIKPANATIDYYLYSEDNGVDLFNISIGNYFKTQEEAEKALERLKIRRQLKDIAARLNKSRKIDWNNFKEQKWYLMYSYPQNTILKDFTDTVKLQGGIYCLDENFKDAAIAEIGEERLKNYLKEC